ncbi:hypothetical protein BsWGS_26115 [Bradybaena similaris]
MKIDDASSSRCEVISNYRFISATEESDSASPVFQDVSSTVVAVPTSNVCSKQMLNTNKPSKPTLCSPLGDDGYITDSMSSMAGSSSSSLSSSWADKSRMYAGNAQGKVTSQTDESCMCSRTEQSGIDSAKDMNTATGSKTKMPLELTQDGYKFEENNRAVLYKHPSHDTRKRDDSLQTSISISSVEDRLGALTTIAEETPGASNDNYKLNAYCGRSRFDMSTGARIQQNAVHSPAVRRYQKRTTENPYLGGDSNYAFLEPEYFRTAHAADVTTGSLPVSPSSTNHQIEEEHCRNGARSFCCRNGSTDCLLSASSPQMNEQGWRVYSSFLEKHFDIPPHNIDPARRSKFLHSNVDDIPDMETKRQLSRFSPAHSLEERSKPTISGNRVLRVSGSEFSLNRLGQSDRPYLYLKSGEQAQEQARFKSEFSNSSYGRGMPLSQSRQTHVRSSMPDLRCQETSSEREFLPDSFRGYQFHHYQQNHQQNYQHTHSHDHPHFRTPQKQNALPSIMDQCTQTHRNYSPCINVRECVQSAPPIHASENLASLSCQNCPETFLRHPLHCNVPSPVCVERASRPFDSSYDQSYFATSNMPNDRKAERHSLDLCNIPQLQKQIRATSELCLQASRRHMFASSADIHKLFSGQIKAPKSVSSISGQSWEGLQYNRNTPASSLQSKTNLMSPLTVQEIPKRIIDQRHISTPSGFVRSMPPSDPVMTNRCCHFPPEASVYKPPLSFSLASEKDSSFSPTLRQTTEIKEINPEVKRHHFKRKGSSRVDADTEQLLLQRQLSDYSSETELQLIESNAEAVKQSQGMQESGLPLHSSAEDFMPINTSAENVSKPSSVHHVADIEPVYANATILATSDISDTSSSSRWLRQPATLSQSYTASHDPYFTSGLAKRCGSAHANPYFPEQPSSAACTNHYVPSAICTRESARFRSSDNIDSSSSSNDDSDTICHGNIYSINPISYSHLPDQNSATVVTSRSFPSQYHRPYNNIKHIHYTKSRPTLANVNTDVIASNPRLGYPVRQSASFHDFSVPCSDRGGSFTIDPYLNTRHSMAGRNHPSAHGCLPGIFHRNGYSSSGRHSVMEKPSLPFETNIVSEDEGDRLSTLV